jgi:hypothetical protein
VPGPIQIRTVDVNTIKTRVILPGGRELEMMTFDPDAVETAKKQSIANSVPYTGLIGKTIVSPLPVQEVGKVEVIMQVDEEEFVCGTLNIIISDPGALSTP